VPLILGADKSRLSKRHGATDVNMYRAEGFLPEAFRNFLALLGWSPGGDEEFIRTKDLIEKFSLAGVSRTNAVFDRPKLEWFNTQYLQKLPIEELLPEVESELKRSGLWKLEWAAGAPSGADGRDHGWFAKTVDLLRPRVRLLPDFSSWSRAFFSDEFPRDPAAIAKFWKDPKTPELLAKLADALEALSEWSHDACDHALRAVAEAGGVKACDARGHRGPGGCSAAVRYHGRARPAARGAPSLGRAGHFLEKTESLQKSASPRFSVRRSGIPPGAWAWERRPRRLRLHPTSR